MSTQTVSTAAAPTPLRPAFDRQSLVYLALATIVMVVVSGIGGIFTEQSMLWYVAILRKPWFTPPTWLFPVAWTTLYTLIAYAFWRVLRVEKPAGKLGAVLIFAVQILLNLGWSWLFFGRQDPAAAGIEVLAFEASILATIVSFRSLDRLASILLWPYAAWVAFASLLNWAIVFLNPVFPDALDALLERGCVLLERGAHDLPQLGQAERLGDHILDDGVEFARALTLVGIPGHQQDGQVRIVAGGAQRQARCRP